MAVTAFTAASILIGDLDASPFVNSVTSEFTVEMLDASTCGSAGYRSYAAGMRQGEMGVEGFEDWAVGGFYEKISQADGGLSTLMSIANIAPSATLAPGDPVAFMRGPIDALTEGDGAADELAKMAMHISEDTPFYMGVVLAPLATRTTTAAGTEVTLTGPTATQQLAAGLHVTSGSGGTLTVRVQTDTAGFPSATTRITFTATTGPVVRGELLTLTPLVNISTETRIRADWTITAGSFDFAVVAGVNPIV